MMQLINYEASEIWEMFQKRKEYFRTHMEIIAENPEFEVVIYLSEEDRGTTMLPSIVVCIEQNEVYSEAAVNEHDCEQTVKKIYFEYLNEERLINMMLKEDDEVDEHERALLEDEIEQRDCELYDAVDLLLDTFLNEGLDRIVGYADADNIRTEVVDHLCEYLYTEHGLSVYRPMFLEDEDGEDFFEEFPYDCMIFDD